jgi:glycosyltransferase involved in cell wall biosynthesis
MNQSVGQLPASIASRIQRIGLVGDDERDRRVADATILVHPSHYEGFGFPVVEAMALGTPVVTTTGGAIPEIAGDAAVMVEPGDVDALASALVDVLADEQKRAQLIQIGRDRAANFSWAETARGLVDVYGSFL